jgi:hypothetical protein
MSDNPSNKSWLSRVISMNSPIKISEIRARFCQEFQLPHARTGGVLIVAQRRLSTLRHNI